MAKLMSSRLVNRNETGMRCRSDEKQQHEKKKKKDDQLILG
jgi:hypothetical protein